MANILHYSELLHYLLPWVKFAPMDEAVSDIAKPHFRTKVSRSPRD